MENSGMEYVEMMYRERLLGDRRLVTNDFGQWVFLNEEEFRLLKEKNVQKDQQLYEKLKSACIITGKDTSRLKQQMAKQANNLSSIYKGPSLHIVVLTKRCNQSCVYCHASAVAGKNSGNLDLGAFDAKRFIELIMSTPSRSVTIEFQGGEPLLNFKILKQIHRHALMLNKKLLKSVKFTVVTNMEAMNSEKLKYLIGNEINICTSIDGPRLLHDRNRPSRSGESSYEFAKKWILEAKKKGVRIGALATVSRESLRYSKEIIDEYMALGFDNIHLRELNYMGKAAGIWKDIGYSAGEFIAFWKKAIDYIISINKQGRFFSERTCTILLQKMLFQKEPNYLDIMSPCGAILGQMAYNYDGSIYTCDEARMLGEPIFRIGSSADSSVQEIMERDESIQMMSASVNDAYFCNFCVYKPYCGVCPVCNYKETGNLICDIRRSQRCSVLMSMFDYLFTRLNEPGTDEILKSWADENIYKQRNVIK